MAKDKDKLINKAQNLLKKGQVDKAISEYLKALAVDKKDVRLHMRLGDLYSTRKKDNEKAVEFYLKAAKILTKDGFYSRAAAVYRQILQLDDSNLEILQELANLYTKLGLNNEAMAQYQRIATQFERDGRLKESLEVVQSMLDLDPGNVVIATKLAELYYKNGDKDLGYQAFRQALDQLQEEGRYEQYLKLLEKLAKADPDNNENLKELAQIYFEHKQWDRAYAVLARIHKNEPEDTETINQLSNAALKAGRPDEAVKYLKILAGIYKSKGLRQRFKEALRKVLEIHPDDQEAIKVVGDAKPILQEEEAPPEEIEEVMEAPLEVLEEDDSEDEEIIESATLIEEEEPEEAPAVGDIQEHLTEAGVYLKYGLRDKALHHIQLVLKADSKNLKAHLALKDIHLEAGDTSKAVTELQWVTVNALEAGENKVAKGAVQEWLQLEPGNAEAVSLAGRVEAAAPGAVAAQEMEIADEAEEIIEAHIEAEEIEDEAAVAVDDEDYAEVEEIEVDDAEVAEVDDSHLIEEVEEVEETPPSAAADEVAEEVVEAEEEYEAVAQEVEEVAEEEAPEAAPSPTRNYSDNLEEAEFYIQQGLVDEARVIYLEILENDPGDEFVAEKLRELEASQPEEVVISDEEPAVAYTEEAPPEEEAPVIIPEPPAAEPAPAVEEPPAPEPEPVEPAAAQAPPEIEMEPEPAVEEPPAPEPEPAEPAAAQAPPEIEMEPEPAAEPPPPQPEPAPPAPASSPAAEPEEMFDLQAEVGAAESDEGFFVGPAPPPGADLFEESGEGEDLFDLAAELSKDDELSGESSSFTGLGSTAEEFSFEETLQAFKKGVSQQISEHDSSTHFDLGIAYKEMGLLDEAIQEFLTASRDPERYAECMLISAMILREKGDLDKALDTCKTALSREEAQDKDKGSFYFEMAQTLLASGEKAKAKWSLERTRELDHEHPELDNMLSGLADVQAEPVALDEEPPAAAEAPPEPDEDDMMLEQALGVEQEAPAPQPPPEQPVKEEAPETPVDTGPPPSREQTTWQKAALDQPEETAEGEKEEDKKKKKKKRKKISYV
jgi:tetratricopeptide (TPR) repeat protein